MENIDIEILPPDPGRERMGYTAREIYGAPFIYTPYIPLQFTPTLHTSDLIKIKTKTYPIKEYRDIYPDINDRFKMLDL